MNDAAPTVSIVIPVHNSRRTISRCLDSLCRLDHSAYEVIIVDDGSTDGTPEICESYDGVRVVRLPRGGPSRARNVGIRAASGELVAFTDGDCVADPQWLKELEKGFVGPQVAGVGGDQRSPEDESSTGKSIQEFLKAIGFMTDYIKTGNLTKETAHNPSCNVAYRRSVLEKVGRFDETLWPGEDVELDLRIRRSGHKLVYNPCAVVGHYRPSTYRGFARMMWRYGACQWPLVWRYGPFRKIHYEPAIVVLGLLGLAALLVSYPGTWPLLLLPWLIIFLYFLLKTRQCTKASLFTFLMLLTLATWNWGFFNGWRYNPLD